jgi:hypothetical protein
VNTTCQARFIQQTVKPRRGRRGGGEVAAMIDVLILGLAIVSALVCVLCCAARFGLSRQAIIAEHELADAKAETPSDERRELAA